jgi:transglutaminase-like putative cysteine protease
MRLAADAPWPAPAEARRAPEREEALARTALCDHDHPSVEAALAAAVDRAGAQDERAVAVAAFEFVRDEIRYALGAWGITASSTVAQREGMCTNKANLLVALLRRAGIPAAYGVLHVNAREYFGTIGQTFVTRYMSTSSTHVYAAAMLDGRWVKCDPSTDGELSSRTAHFCRQTMLIEWDGEHDSLDFLDPAHIYEDFGLFADIDDLLAKPARGATPARFALWNDYLAFIRREPRFVSIEALADAYLARPETQALIAEADAPK